MASLLAFPTPLAGLMRVDRTVRADARGAFSRMFCDAELAGAGWAGPVRQANHTITRTAGTVRGMHFQCGREPEYKLVTCVAGEVFDVAVDLRRGSKTFLHWHAERLSADNACSLLIPPGFAHGFQCLAEEAQMLYFHSSAYEPAAEGGMHPADPALAIEWPLPIRGLSDRDAGHAPVTAAFRGIEA